MSPSTAIPPRRARGVVDPDTGAIVALTGWAVFRLSGGRVEELTPVHDWATAAAGGGAVAMADSGFLTWTDGRHTRCVPAEELYRVAVRGATVAGATEDGTLTVWTGLDRTDPPAPLRGRFAGSPDGVALATAPDRLAVWGWPESGPAELSMFALQLPELPRLPLHGWPEPSAGVAFPLAGDAVAVATRGELIVLGPDATLFADHPVEGLEKVTGRGTTLAWIRSVRGRARPVVGVGQLAGGALVDVVEEPLPGPDRFPELAVLGTAAVLVAGVAADQLAVHRLDRDGWAPPQRLTVPPAKAPA